MRNKVITEIYYEKPHVTALWLASFYFFGIIWHSISFTFSIILFITPFILLSSGIFVLIPEIIYNRRFLIWAASSYIITFTIEAFGVSTGKIFGNYIYSEILGPGLFNVPFIIAFNWIIVVFGIIVLLKSYIKSPAVIVLSASLLCALFDFIMEPAAVYLNYWSWEKNIIPLQNYFAWFCTAALCSCLYEIMKVERESKLSGYYFLIQVFFFIGLNTIFFIKG